jgi:MoaA/NifB/PqqE/SkfB family radical SAM enzyme
MSERMFENIIGQAPSVRELFFVGLGEPLLHNQLETFVACAHQRNITTRLVTNGLAADSGRLVKLRARGLSEVTFSIDTTDPALFKKLRSNADLSIILDNIRGVPAGLTRSLFVTLSKNNIDSLPGIIDLASELSLPAIAFSDLNFPQNLHDTVAAFPQTDTLLSNIRYAHNKNILLITPHFHNYGGPLRNYFQTCMVRNPEDICKRTTFHRNCLAPWRIAVVDVHGNVNPCNCTPQDIVGNLVGQPFADVWNGENIQSWRNGVLCGTNVVCQSCPRY